MPRFIGYCMPRFIGHKQVFLSSVDKEIPAPNAARRRQTEQILIYHITDDELLHLMKEQFELLCFGDLDYLEGTCLADFAQAVRAGYEG